MVIKKNPKTGKYYIAYSPPSFYNSRNKTSILRILKKKRSSNSIIKKSQTKHRSSKNIIKDTKRKSLMDKSRSSSLKKFNQLNSGRSIGNRSSFTVAVPVGRDGKKVIIQDYTFGFSGKKLISSKKLNGKISIDKNDFIRRSGIDIY